MNKEKKNSDGLDNLDNYFMSITYMLKFLTYINQPSGKEIEEIFNEILLKIKIEKDKQENIKDQKEFGDNKLSPKIEKIINFIEFNKTLFIIEKSKEKKLAEKSKVWEPRSWNWKRNWSVDTMRELFVWRVIKEDKYFYNKLEIQDDNPLIEALLHVVDLLSKHASIIVLNKRIISSGYDTALPINSNLTELINLKTKKCGENTTYEKKYTIINSVVNAINNSANVQASTKGATIYTTSLLTPKDVYFAIQAEINEIIYLEIDYSETTLNKGDVSGETKSKDEDFSYDDNSKEVIGMLLESGIKYKKMLINNNTNKNNFLKSIIDFGYYYKNDEIQRQELLTFTNFIAEVQYKVKNCKDSINSETWVNTIFMAISYIVSFRSFDGSSKVGCSFVKEIIFGEFKQYILYSTGYNGFPNTLSHFHDKGKKEEYMVHAETNAILSIIKNNAKIHKNTIVYSNLYSCDECLKSLFNVGVEKIIYFEERYKKNSNIKDIKNSFLSDEEYFKNTWLFDNKIIKSLKTLEEECVVKPFIDSFISFYKFNYFFNENIDDLIKEPSLLNNNIEVEKIKKSIVEYYSNYNLWYFLINNNYQHQTIFNSDLKLIEIEEKFKRVIKLIKDYMQNCGKCSKHCNKKENINCEEKSFKKCSKHCIKDYDEDEYKDFQNIIEKI